MSELQSMTSSINWKKFIADLGVEKQLGTLEEGKLASFVVSDGDILDIKSNNIIGLNIMSPKKENPTSNIRVIN